MPSEVAPADEVVEDKGVRVLIDPKAVLFLLGTEMDYKTEKLSAQFVFNNPNQTSACGCGESVQLKPAADTVPARTDRRGGPSCLPTTSANCLPLSGRSRCAACSAAPASMPTARCSHWSHDGVIYLEGGRAERSAAFEREGLAPFTYTTKDGRRGVMSYRRMPDRLYDDPDELAAWARDCAGGGAARGGAQKAVAPRRHEVEQRKTVNPASH